MIIEPEHLIALFNENEITIAEAEAAGSRSTAAAYHEQQVIRAFIDAPAATFEDVPAQGDAPDPSFVIRI